MTPLHIIEFTLGLGLARRRRAGSAHAAIDDATVALVPSIGAVVVGKGVRGASVCFGLDQLSLSIGSVKTGVRERPEKLSRDSRSARLRRTHGAGEHVLARCEESIGGTGGNVPFRIVADAGDYLGASDAVVPESYGERGLMSSAVVLQRGTDGNGKKDLPLLQPVTATPWQEQVMGME